MSKIAAYSRIRLHPITLIGWVMMTLFLGSAWPQTLSPTSARKEFVYLGGRLVAVDAVTGILPPPPVSVVINSPLQGSTHPNSNINLSWTATANPTISRCEVKVDAGPWMPYPLCANGSATLTQLSSVHIPDTLKALGLDFAENTGTTTYDRSGSAFNGTLQNGAAWTTGKYGVGLSLDGVDDHVRFGDVLDFNPTDTFSFSFWIKPTALDRYIIAKQDNFQYGQGYAIYLLSDGRIQFSINYITVNLTQIALSAASSLTATLNVWNHIVVTNNGSAHPPGIKFYINGVEATTQAGADTLGATATPTSEFFQIGCREGCTFNRYQGVIDEVAVYRRVLAPTEVAGIYNDTAFNGSHTLAVNAYNPLNESGTATAAFTIGAPTIPNPVFWHKFNTGSGSTATADAGDNCSLSNHAWVQVPAASGNYAIDFNGTTTIANCGSALDNLATFSIAAWIRPDNFGESSLGHVIAKVNASSVRSWALMARNSGPTTNGVSASVWQADNSNQDVWDASSVLAPNGSTWYHLAVVVSNCSNLGTCTAQLYLNGASVGTQIVNGTGARPDDSTFPVSIGNRAATDRTFDGLIDDVRVWNQALTGTEINAVYSGGRQ